MEYCPFSGPRSRCSTPSSPIVGSNRSEQPSRASVITLSKRRIVARPCDSPTPLAAVHKRAAAFELVSGGGQKSAGMTNSCLQRRSATTARVSRAALLRVRARSGAPSNICDRNRVARHAIEELRHDKNTIVVGVGVRVWVALRRSVCWHTECTQSVIIKPFPTITGTYHFAWKIGRRTSPINASRKISIQTPRDKERQTQRPRLLADQPSGDGSFLARRMRAGWS